MHGVGFANIASVQFGELALSLHMWHVKRSAGNIYQSKNFIIFIKFWNSEFRKWKKNWAYLVVTSRCCVETTANLATILAIAILDHFLVQFLTASTNCLAIWTKPKSKPPKKKLSKNSEKIYNFYQDFKKIVFLPTIRV